MIVMRNLTVDMLSDVLRCKAWMSGKILPGPRCRKSGADTYGADEMLKNGCCGGFGR